MFINYVTYVSIQFVTLSNPLYITYQTIIVYYAKRLYLFSNAFVGIWDRPSVYATLLDSLVNKKSVLCVRAQSSLIFIQISKNL